MLIGAPAQPCPKCRACGMARKICYYPILGYSELEIACFICGLMLWPRADESPRRAYYRWLMDRLAPWPIA